MSNHKIIITAAPVAVDRPTAARMLGMSVDSFERYCQPNLKLIRRGKLRLVPVAQLEAWCEENAKRMLPKKDA